MQQKKDIPESSQGVIKKIPQSSLHNLNKVILRHAIRSNNEFPKHADKTVGIVKGYISKLDRATDNRHIVKPAKSTGGLAFRMETRSQFIGEVMSSRLMKILLTNKVPFNGVNVDDTYHLKYHSYVLSQKMFGGNMAIRSEKMKNYRDLYKILKDNKLPVKEGMVGFAQVVTANIAIGNGDIFNNSNIGLSRTTNEDGMFLVKCLDFGQSGFSVIEGGFNPIKGKAMFADCQGVHKWLSVLAKSNEFSSKLFSYNIFEFRNAADYISSTMTDEVIDNCIEQGVQVLRHIKFDPKLSQTFNKAFYATISTSYSYEHYDGIYQEYLEVLKINDKNIKIDLLANHNFIKLTDIIYKCLGLDIGELEQIKVRLGKNIEIRLKNGLDAMLNKIVTKSLYDLYENENNIKKTYEKPLTGSETYD